MKLLFVGDVMLGRFVNETLKQKPPSYPWGDTLAIFKNADLRICNLECVMSDRGQPYSATPKVFHFRSDAKNIAVLKTAGINAVSVANNHTLDFEYEAMFDMFDLLTKIKIAFAGAGTNIDKASNPAICEIQGQKIAMVAFTDNEPGWQATNKRPGIFYIPFNLSDQRAKNFISQIIKIRQVVDFLIISCHWGPNWGYQPAKSHIPFAHALIEAGAGIIFGHSCHVFQGIEIYKGKPILYSCGDFIDDYAVDEIERNDQSFIFIIETDFAKIKSIKLYPTIIDNCQAQLAKGHQAKEIAIKMKNLCDKFNTKSIWQEKNQCLKILLKHVGH